MPAKIYRAYNNTSGALSGTAVLAGQPTSSTANLTRTMLQVAPNATSPGIRVVGWGYCFPAGAPTNNVVLELADTGTVFASALTAHVAAGVQKMNVPTGEASTVQLGTALTGYCTTAAGTASTEGTITASRLFDVFVANGVRDYWRYELGRESEIPPGNCLRLRATPTSAASVSPLVWIDWEE